jgi:hypothetical protein
MQKQLTDAIAAKFAAIKQSLTSTSDEVKAPLRSLLEEVKGHSGEGFDLLKRIDINNSERSINSNLRVSKNFNDMDKLIASINELPEEKFNFSLNQAYET